MTKFLLHLAVTFKSQAQLKRKRTLEITVTIYLFTDSYLLWVARDNRTLQFHSLSYNPPACDKNSHLTQQRPMQAGENCSVFCLTKRSIITLLDVSMCQTATNTNPSIFFQILSPPPSLVLHPFTVPTPTPLPLSYSPSPAPFIFLRLGGGCSHS